MTKYTPVDDRSCKLRAKRMLIEGGWVKDTEGPGLIRTNSRGLREKP